MESIINKIEYEYEIFYLDLMRTSRANIFSKSREIEIKKKIVVTLKKLKLEENMLEKLIVVDNVLDEVYRHMAEVELIMHDALVKDIVESVKKIQG